MTFLQPEPQHTCPAPHLPPLLHEQSRPDVPLVLHFSPGLHTSLPQVHLPLALQLTVASGELIPQGLSLFMQTHPPPLQPKPGAHASLHPPQWSPVPNWVSHKLPPLQDQYPVAQAPMAQLPVESHTAVA